MQGRLVRLPLRKLDMGSGSGYDLAFKLGNLISLKGEDILLSTPSTPLEMEGCVGVEMEQRQGTHQLPGAAGHPEHGPLED